MIWLWLALVSLLIAVQVAESWSPLRFVLVAGLSFAAGCIVSIGIWILLITEDCNE